MIIKRRLYSDYLSGDNNQSVSQTQQVTSRSLQIEQMRLQRQLLQTQRMRQKLQAEERMERSRNLAQLQKSENQKDETQMDNQIKLASDDRSKLNPADRNWNLVKSRTKISQPVSMKA